MAIDPEVADALASIQTVLLDVGKRLDAIEAKPAGADVSAEVAECRKRIRHIEDQFYPGGYLHNSCKASMEFPDRPDAEEPPEQCPLECHLPRRKPMSAEAQQLSEQALAARAAKKEKLLKAVTEQAAEAVQ